MSVTATSATYATAYAPVTAPAVTYAPAVPRGTRPNGWWGSLNDLAKRSILGGLAGAAAGGGVGLLLGGPIGGAVGAMAGGLLTFYAIRKMQRAMV